MKFRKKPVVIEAMQFIVTGYTEHKFGNRYEFNDIEIARFMQDAIHVITVPNGNAQGETYIEIPTLEGVMKAGLGDWIIKGINGEFYPCKNDIFLKTYEPVIE